MEIEDSITDMLEIEDSDSIEIPDELPLMAVRDLIIFPSMIVPLFVGRETSVAAVNEALANDRLIFLTSQKVADEENPTVDDLYRTGVVASIMRTLQLPDGRLKILAQAMIKADVDEFVQEKPYFKVRITPRDREEVDEELSVEVEALMRNIREQAEKLLNLKGVYTPEIGALMASIEEPGRLADLVASNLQIKTSRAQELLEMTGTLERLQAVSELLARELEVSTVQARIQSEAREEMTRTQREYFLREQIKIIRRELGEEKDARQEEQERLEKLIARAGMPPEVEERAREELGRLGTTPVESSEYAVIRNYLDWLTSLPWSRTTEDNSDVSRAGRVLEKDHYGLKEVKERILEFLAVRKLKADHKGPILCFIGPPGVGKTSVGRSVAKAMGRKFWRLSLGGMRDEAEIKGHRRTYVGAMPGRIIQALKLCGSANPVIMLDEVDKVGKDFRGDPASALLEVLDPEQNHEFLDQYLDVRFDLSRILFIATANVVDTIPPPLLDRMEVIEIPGYVQEEKIQIAKRHLIPRQLKNHGLKASQISFRKDALAALIQGYTREAGVRGLEKAIAGICRKTALKVSQGRRAKTVVDAASLEKFLGAPRFVEDEDREEMAPGVAKGLAWTGYGGDVLYIEAASWPGKGRIAITGKLGQVMEESARIALDYVKSRARDFGVDLESMESQDLHIHFPAGAIPKDGPSAGITIATAVISLLTGRPVPPKLAMTGELTLTGEVLAIGGVREKVLAAQRRGIEMVLLPVPNRKDIKEIPREMLKGLKVKYVSSYQDVYRAVFGGNKRGRRRG